VNTGGFRARTRERGKHRTEVTEATEGELFWWPRRRWGEAPLACAGSFTIFSCLPCSPDDASPFARSHAEAAGVHPSSPVHQPKIPLCGLRDLCAMLSPYRVTRAGTKQLPHFRPDRPWREG
jgi:hypothetical protein